MTPDIQLYWIAASYCKNSRRALYRNSNSEAMWHQARGYSSTCSTSHWLEVSEWSVSHSPSFIPKEKAPSSHLTGDRVRPRNNTAIAVNRTTIPRTSNSQPIHYSTWAIQTLSRTVCFLFKCRVTVKLIRITVNYQWQLYLIGQRCGAVGWGTALQAGRSRVRFPMASLEVLIDIIPATAWSWGRLSL
jgi:hypothetical protein